MSLGRLDKSALLKRRAADRDIAEAVEYGVRELAAEGEVDQVERLLREFPTEAEFRAQENALRAHEVPIGVDSRIFDHPEALAACCEDADDSFDDDGW